MMRVAWFCLAAATACAHGSSDNADPAADARLVTIDAPSCDGLPCDAIYVSRAGNDAAAGTRETPLQSINAAITMASGWNPPMAVFVQSGTYNEQVAMKVGVPVYGGFDETWTRNPAVVTEIVAPSPAVTFDQILTGTALDGVSVKSADATAAGESSYAILITGSKLISLVDVTVTPGIGARGVDGNDGATGAAGGNGGIGTPGCEDSGLLCASCDRPPGGKAGTSACGRLGGVGGMPGHENGAGDRGGNATGVAQGGGAGGGASANGQPGANGAPGTAGSAGAGGLDVGVFERALYVPASGAGGSAGSHGFGGGGGGGGGGGATDCDSYGSSGGGGGGGGCGGTAGTGGSGGGGSFGVVAVDSAVTITSSMVIANRGGDGGRGGYGGGGGSGGAGGGGGGGPSAALVCVGETTMTIPMSTIMGGTGGLGGPSAGHAGAPGVSTKFIGCSFF